MREPHHLRPYNWYKLILCFVSLHGWSEWSFVSPSFDAEYRTCAYCGKEQHRGNDR